MSGWDYVWMAGMMVFWAAVVAGIVWGAVTLIRGDRLGRGEPSAREGLDRRLARGEISEDEYNRRRELIGSSS